MPLVSDKVGLGRAESAAAVSDGEERDGKLADQERPVMVETGVGEDSGVAPIEQRPPWAGAALQVGETDPGQGADPLVDGQLTGEIAPPVVQRVESEPVGDPLMDVLHVDSAVSAAELVGLFPGTGRLQGRDRLLDLRRCLQCLCVLDEPSRGRLVGDAEPTTEGAHDKSGPVHLGQAPPSGVPPTPSPHPRLPDVNNRSVCGSAVGGG